MNQEIIELLEKPGMWHSNQQPTIDRIITLLKQQPAASTNKDLLEACEGLMEKADNGSADFDDPEPGSIYLKAEAAIAKARNTLIKK